MSHYEEEYSPPFLVALILLPPIAPIFWKYRCAVDDKALSVGFSYYFHQEIDRSTIVNVEVVKHINGLTGWGGWGYRLNLRGEKGYITKNGTGIRLVYKTEDEKEHVIVFNCEDAEKVSNILKTPALNAVVH